MTDGDQFEAFWKLYPRRVGKLDALKAWNRLKVTPGLFEQMVGALTWQMTSRDWTRDGGQFVPYPATWLRQGRWMDERPTRAPMTVTPEDVRRAEHLRSKVYGRCPHEPQCGTYRECVIALASSSRHASAESVSEPTTGSLL